MMRRLAGVLMCALAAGVTLAADPGYRLPRKFQTALAGMSGERIRSDLKFLSSDLLEGRGTGERGGALAAAYLAAQFEQMGLRPGAADGSYLQRVPLMGITTEAATSLRFTGPRGSLAPKYLDDYVAWSRTEEAISDTRAEMVFVGFGITAPEYDWDDYKGLDVRGKVLVMLVNDPPADDPKFFGGPALTYYGRWTYKFEEGLRRGAAGVLLVHTTPSAGYGWRVVQNSWSKEQPFVGRVHGDSALKLEGWISSARARELFDLAGRNLETDRDAAARREFRPVPLNLTVAAHIVSRVRPIETANVLGLLEGGDPARKGEALVYTAHYDHLGVGKEEKGDAIYNGAVDNASGVAILLEVARSYLRAAAAGARPPRSILFIAVAAEEGGLRGSEYYAAHPTFPPGRIAANLNIDGIQVIGEALEYTFLGADKTTLGPIIAWAEKAYQFRSVPDPEPGQGSYYRSDHFNFASIGVPAVSIDQGDKFAGQSAEWGKRAWEDYNENRYHRPADEYDPRWDFSGLVKLGRIAGAVGWVIAAGDRLPTWRAGDEFLPAREASWKGGR